ncbi:DUF397 domain-containing protein [Glycomyces tritici]|uniref:DUF397 domain-containing protein n=1 Tax=Glycomyces tritici TaxID=2665176 RepID=A0ABT7YWK3_9ACTN|nr:DUF397 domain-containing protein [Glycomyces tritici]MDN3243012.1 DUF397 domain-containing protein [Glycomyces tritici]
MDFCDGRTWRKSSRSGEQGECVFVAAEASSVGVRDSKEGPAGAALWVGRGDWALLTRHLSR